MSEEGLFWQQLQTQLAAAVAGFAGVAGIAVLDLVSGREIGINADELFPTASAIKIHILTQLLLCAERGEVDLAQRIAVDPAEIVLGSGVLAYLPGPVEMRLLDIATLMIIVSDNSATNICLRLAGIEATNQMIRALGLRQTHIRRKMMDHLAAVAELENVSTPREMLKMMALLHEGKPVARTAQMALEILRKPKESTLTAALPEGTSCANKAGYVDGARCDVGLVELDRRPYGIALMSKYAMGSKSEHADALIAMARMVHTHFVALNKSNCFGRYVYE